MKKLGKFLILILFLVSCQKDSVFDGTDIQENNMIFESPISKVSDGQNISFKIETAGEYQLVLLKDDEVLTKETFQSEVGLNTRKIFTKILPKGELKLLLKNDNVILTTTIIVD